MKKIEELTGIPVLGVVPWFAIPLPSEDSLSLGDKKTKHSLVRIGVIRLPKISNFTDFELLEQHALLNMSRAGDHWMDMTASFFRYPKIPSMISIPS